jgi:NADPH-dependent ferric siderophore reductase
VLARVGVDRVERLSPAFTRIWFAGAELAEFGNPGETYDQRIKVIFPPAGGRLPEFTESADWWQQWQALHEEERGAMRTYSIRDIVGAGPSTQVAVDFVLHDADGHTGPASQWASGAAPGDQVLLVGPRRGEPWGGVEFRPDGATSLLLAGDETAAPAISRILLDLEPGLTGDAFIEVPSEDDILPLQVPAGFEVHWLPRDAAQRSLRSLGTSESRRIADAATEFGSRLIPAVVEHFGVHPHGRIQDVDTEFPVWETPIFSSLGEELEGGRGIPGLYTWIAGESGVVTTLRRHLVREVGLARHQVAFMGYWRKGVAMRG